MAPLSAQDAAHLLRRSGFGGGWGAAPNDLTALTGMELGDAVELILEQQNVSSDAPPAEFADPGKGDWERVWALTLWWFERMRTARVTGRTAAAPQASPLQEKMSLFWHGHFASSEDKVGNATHMYDQHHAFRALGLGNFQDLCLTVTTVPHACEAMLRYLDNDPNEKQSPNENLARELMELFTMGVNNYTQDDVTAGARAWTGYNIDDTEAGNHTFRFYPERHDSGTKTLLGVTAAWDAPGMVRHLCTGTAVNPVTGVAPPITTSRYLARKIWSFFAYPINSSDPLVESLAANWRANGLEVTALLRDVFTRPEFFSTQAKRGLMRSPVELITAILRSTGLTIYQAMPWDIGEMGQQPFYPPNVAGWKQNSYWLSTSSAWFRANYIHNNVRWGVNSRPNPRFLSWTGRDPVTRTYPMTPEQAVDNALLTCGITEPSTGTRARLVAWLTAQRAASNVAPYEWRDLEFLNLATLVFLSPDFQLA
ncbi:MAG: DUF1800 domain-containing protein [Acidimicrobiia bacterium]